MTWGAAGAAGAAGAGAAAGVQAAKSMDTKITLAIIFQRKPFLEYSIFVFSFVMKSFQRY
jgi:hypothetical protein